MVGAGLVATSLARIYSDSDGFDPRRLQNVAFPMEKAGLKGDALVGFYRDMGQRLRHLPGVTGVSFELMTPLQGYQWDEDFPDTKGASHDTYINAVAPQYFSTMRIPVLGGRQFTWNDTPSSGMKVILNQTAAGQLFPGENALGRTIGGTKARRSACTRWWAWLATPSSPTSTRPRPPLLTLR